jgi:hypothetical protein
MILFENWTLTAGLQRNVVLERTVSGRNERKTLYITLIERNWSSRFSDTSESVFEME